jgi:ABC-type bacteriocin/lantibiotic exporter with double-glycine peptidase domain
MELTVRDFADVASQSEALPHVGRSLLCENLFFRYSRKAEWVINDFSHQFAPGITLIKGSSGCGKSTLLRMLAGYLKCTGGIIFTTSGVLHSYLVFYRKDMCFVF